MTMSAVVDTTTDVEMRMVDRWRAMPAWRRFEQVAELNDACDRMAELGVRQRHPSADERDVRLRLLALKLGRDLMVDVYGWDPDVEGW